MPAHPGYLRNAIAVRIHVDTSDFARAIHRLAHGIRRTAYAMMTPEQRFHLFSVELRRRRDVSRRAYAAELEARDRHERCRR